ncbi:hypothetical protein L7F22_031893 [Adiantum nelumboides]|nr:hypothetical protein [Adiantum nelumboides]
MRLLTADLSLDRSFSPSATSSKDPDTSNCLMRGEQFYTHPNMLSSDLHALEMYHKSLEDERLKIQAFERELPFCMQLLDDAIEASKEKLEERLTCKLNTPLHDPPTHHQFVCKYTNSLTQGSASAPETVGEINLHFKHKWTSLPLSSTANKAAPLEPTKWLLKKCTSPPSIKDPTSSRLLELKECTPSDCATPQAPERMQETRSLMISSSTKSAPACPSQLTKNAMQYLSSMQNLFYHPTVAETEVVQLLENRDDDTIKVPDEKRRCIQATQASMPINMPALINANLSPTNPYSRSISCITKPFGPQELHINTGLSSPLAKATSSPGRNSINIQPGGAPRKPRRCWSPELHQRFLSALNHLGGCQVATPKQIRELMNVEGLTNDEVKSHLQKFRLHMRRPNGVVANPAQSNSPQTTGHHLLVFGHIWVPPEYDQQHEQYGIANLNMHTSNDLPASELYGENREVQQLGIIQSLNNDHKTDQSEDVDIIEDGGCFARAASINSIDLTPVDRDDNNTHDQHKILTNVADFQPQRDAINPNNARTPGAVATSTLSYHDEKGDMKQLLHLMQARDGNASTGALDTSINIRGHDA